MSHQSWTDIIFENGNYQIPRENRCCVCGSTERLTRHHILPQCYISKLCQEVKKELLNEHQYYFEWDYCCLCGECHHRFKKEFDMDLHKKIWALYNIDLKKTSYKRRFSGDPKPSTFVMQQINNAGDYYMLRNFCTEYFKKAMQPKYSLL